MPRRDESHRYCAIEQRKFAAEVSRCLVAGLRFRVTEHRNHRRVEIEVRNQCCARALPDLDCITDMIGMPVRKQNKIDVVERGELLFAARENRIC